MTKFGKLETIEDFAVAPSPSASAGAAAFPIISRKEAKARGLKLYFVGTPCKNGHIALLTIGHGCIECKKQRDHNYKLKNSLKIKKVRRDYQLKNSLKIKKARRDYYVTHKKEKHFYYLKNLEKIKARTKQYNLLHTELLRRRRHERYVFEKAALSAVNKLLFVQIIESYPPTRELAILLHRPFYFTGRPCCHGHVSNRRTINRRCEQCAKQRRIKPSPEKQREYNQRYRLTYPERYRASMQRSRRRLTIARRAILKLGGPNVRY